MTKNRKPRPNKSARKTAAARAQQRVEAKQRRPDLEKRVEALELLLQETENGLRRELLGVVQSAMQSISQQVSKSIHDLSSGQMSVENQFMASLRHTTVHTTQALVAFQTYLRSQGVGIPTAVPMSKDQAEALYAPPPNYEDANFHLDVWMKLRERRPNDFRDHMAAYVEGLLTLDAQDNLVAGTTVLLPEAPKPTEQPQAQPSQEEVTAALKEAMDEGKLRAVPLPPEDAEPVEEELAVGELGPDADELEEESAAYGGAAIFGGDLADDYTKRLEDEREEEGDGLTPVTSLSLPEPREVTDDITGEFEVKEDGQVEPSPRPE